MQVQRMHGAAAAPGVPGMQRTVPVFGRECGRTRNVHVSGERDFLPLFQRRRRGRPVRGSAVLAVASAVLLAFPVHGPRVRAVPVSAVLPAR